jgi:membrane protein YdbS with pleckstrin-like domain
MQNAIRRLVMAENADMVVEVVERKQQFLVMALFSFCVILPIIGGYNSTENKTWWMILPLVVIVILFLIVGLLDKFKSSNS